MRALFGNKKRKVGIILTLVGVSILITSLSFAFFRSTGSAGTGNVTIGSLRVEAGLDADGAFMGPGYTQDGLIGTVKNSGSLESLVQLKFNYNITIKSDGNGNSLDPSNYYLAPADQQYIKVNLVKEGYQSPIDPDRYAQALGIWYNMTNDSMYVWAKGADDNFYVMMMGNDTLHFAYEIVVADNTPFDYMDADITITLDYIASQLIPDAAVMEAFGISDLDSFLTYYEEFIMYDPTGGGTTIRPFINPVTMAIAKVAAMPESSFKTQLLEILENR